MPDHETTPPPRGRVQFSLRALFVGIACVALLCLAAVCLSGPTLFDALLLLAAAGLALLAARRGRWPLLVALALLLAPPVLMLLWNLPRVAKAGYDWSGPLAGELLWSAGMAGLLLGVAAAASVHTCTARSRLPWQPILLVLAMLAALGLYGWSEWHYQRPKIEVRVPPAGFGPPPSAELQLQSHRGRGRLRLYWHRFDGAYSKPHPAGEYWGYGGGIRLAGAQVDYLRGRKSDVDVIFGPHLDVVIPYWQVGLACIVLLAVWWMVRRRARRAAGD